MYQKYGRLRDLSERNERKVVRDSLQGDQTLNYLRHSSTKTVSTALVRHIFLSTGYTQHMHMKQAPLVRANNIKKRLEWSMDHMSYEVDEWQC